jgi:DNA replication protein DnaC
MWMRIRGRDAGEAQQDKRKDASNHRRHNIKKCGVKVACNNIAVTPRLSDARRADEGLDHIRFLLRVAELELIDRERRMVERRIKEARFPAVKSLDSFDFAAIPSLNKTLVLELARSMWRRTR